MKTWNDYKEYVKEADPESRKTIEEVEALSSIISTIIKQRNTLGKSFDAFSNFLPNFGTMVSSIHRKTGCDSGSSGISFNAMEAVIFMKLE